MPKISWSLRVAGSAAAVFGFATFVVSPACARVSFDVIYSFTNTAGGWAPMGELVADNNNIVYGTTQAGGKACPDVRFSCGGTVYRLVPPTSAGGSWSHDVLYSFKGGKDGAAPAGGVIVRPDNGLIHGTTEYGGDTSCTAEPHGWGCGTVFELAPPASGTNGWPLVILHRFKGQPDGELPTTRMLQLKNGTYYGSTASGGSGGQGLIYRLVPTAAAGTNQVSEGYEAYLDAFFHDSGPGDTPLSLAEIVRLAMYINNAPNAPITPRSTPPFFGTATFGGSDGCGGPTGNGTLYEVTPTNRQDRKPEVQVLHCFAAGDQSDGAFPDDDMVIGPDLTNLTLYGTALGGNDCGSIGHNGCGIVFRYIYAGRKYEVLHRFSGADGALPIGHLAIDKKGNVYGATQLGGTCDADTRGCGVIYRLSPPARPGQNWTRRVLHAFQGGADGKEPTSGLLQVGRMLFGTTDRAVYAVSF